jgi:hypothetical protein
MRLPPSFIRAVRPLRSARRAPLFTVRLADSPRRKPASRLPPQPKALVALPHFAKSRGDDLNHSALSWMISHIVGRAWPTWAILTDRLGAAKI